MIKKQKEEIIVMSIFLLALLTLFIILNFISPLTIWDENAYLGNARSHVSYSNYTEDFRFPLTEYLVSFIWGITGESVFFARLGIIILTLLSTLFMYAIGKKFSQRNFLF